MKTAEEFLESKGWHEDNPTIGGVLFISIAELMQEYSEQSAQERYEKAVEYWHENIDDRVPPMDEYEEFARIAAGIDNDKTE